MTLNVESGMEDGQHPADLHGSLDDELNLYDFPKTDLQGSMEMHLHSFLNADLRGSLELDMHGSLEWDIHRSKN
nr:hypothetical protein Iba_chr13eCG1340 [Ipomoea batatas]